jgi:hypothetical protein
MQFLPSIKLYHIGEKINIPNSAIKVKISIVFFPIWVYNTITRLGNLVKGGELDGITQGSERPEPIRD